MSTKMKYIWTETQIFFTNSKTFILMSMIVYRKTTSLTSKPLPTAKLLVSDEYSA